MILIYEFRKYLTFKWKMNKRDNWAKIITCYQNKAMMKKRKYKMPCCFKKRKKQNKPKWLNIKMNKKKDKISSDLSKKTKWKIKLDSKAKDWPKWKSMKREEGRSWWQEKSMKKNALKKSSWEI